jgi:glycoprotein endo-alpha-1,2-mannosidase
MKLISLLLLLSLLIYCDGASHPISFDGINKTMAFYYLWYDAPENSNANSSLVDAPPENSNDATKRVWSHWDHHILPHWNKDVAAQWPGEETRWKPPHDIHAPFYPARGPYSSRNSSILRSQFHEMRRAGIGIAIASWWGRVGVSAGDSQGVLTDDALSLTLDAAHAAALEVVKRESDSTTVAIHLEPYAGRTAASTRADVIYLFERFGNHPALFRDDKGRPLFFIYDSYHISQQDWADEISKLRGTQYDSIFFGLWLNRGDASALSEGLFDGVYTYFASETVGYGSDRNNWDSMSREALQRGLGFSPSVSPGYDDTKIRPWNRASFKARHNGETFKASWEAVLSLSIKPTCVTITTYNEWGEGTQIESAVPRTIDVDLLALSGNALSRDIRSKLQLLNSNDSYDDYGGGGPHLYLDLTKQFSKRLASESEKLDL